MSPSPSTPWSCWRACAPSCGAICSSAQTGSLTLGGIELDDKRKTVTLDGEPVSLTPREYDILRFLLQHPGEVFSPGELYRRVWNEEPFGAESTVAVHIRHLREKLEIDPAQPRYIRAVWGRGYKIEK